MNSKGGTEVRTWPEVVIGEKTDAFTKQFCGITDWKPSEYSRKASVQILHVNWKPSV